MELRAAYFADQDSFIGAKDCLICLRESAEHRIIIYSPEAVAFSPKASKSIKLQVQSLGVIDQILGQPNLWALLEKYVQKDES